METYLELKHLAGYLPYDLKGQYLDCFGEVETRWKGKKIETFSCNLWGFTGIMETFKPILHPLSDLTKEIEINGEKFVPIQKLEDKYFEHFGNHQHRYAEIFADLLIIANPPTETLKKYLIDIMPKFILEELYEWHFDIHNLNENGLAIDVNSLEINPYK